jgi:ParB-like chromosome segregation protein Spo0J
MLRKIAVGKLRPNPFRRLDEYPIQREKIDALKRSFASTGFWGTIVGRPVDDGCIEIAFGHHRLKALQEAMKPKECVELIVRDLSNETMLRMMADENQEEWGSSFWIQLETVRSVMEAIEKGEIKLDVSKYDNREGSQSAVNPSHSMVAKFLGWIRKAKGNCVQPNFVCETCFLALKALKANLITERDVRKMKVREAYEMCSNVLGIHDSAKRNAEEQRQSAAADEARAAQARTKAEKDRFEHQAAIARRQAEQQELAAELEPRNYARQMGEGVRAGSESEKSIRERGAEVQTALNIPREREIRDVNGYIESIINKLDYILFGDDDISGNLSIVLAFRDDRQVNAKLLRNLCRASAALRRRLQLKIEDVFQSDDSQ